MKKLMALLMALVMLTMVACSSAPAESTATESTSQEDAAPAQEETGEVVEIEFIQWWAAESGGEYLDTLITNFEAEYPNIKVTPITVPFGDVRNQTVANHATGTSADVIAMNPPWVREFYDLGILEPLTDYIANDDTYMKDIYQEVSFSEIEGDTYVVPYTQMAFFLYYNIDMFTAAGLDAPTSLEEVIAAAKALTNPNENQYGISLVLSEQAAGNGSILSLYPLLYALNGRTLVDGKFTVDTPEMLQAMQVLATMQADGSFLPGTTSKTEIQVVEEFAQGNIGMMFEHDGHIVSVEDRNPDLNYGIIPIPTMDGTGEPELRHHGWDIGMSVNSEHKEEAWTFISYITAEENLMAAADGFQKVPAIKGAVPGYAESNEKVVEAIEYMGEYAMVEELMLMPQSSACWTELTKAGAAVIQGTKTPEEALADCQASWDELLGQ